MIYLVEDDKSNRELVLYTLRATGFEAVGFERGEELWQALEESLPSLILLDIMLPGEDGLSILKKLRSSSKTSRIPVIMLTAKGSEYDKVIGLDCGADDYIPKPFGMMELVSRIRAVLRRAQPQKIVEYRHGDLYVNATNHTVRVGGEPVNLTLKEFDLLCYLLECEGCVLTRDAILNRVWGYEFDGETRTVDVHIRTLRQKLGDCGQYIETIRGVGYKIGGTP
ncbi:MAG: response regulator transcription factor [Oscillospiraceae bacterium]|nr:response regulator transcription factor [Oscillospiraceae bacterium]